MSNFKSSSVKPYSCKSKHLIKVPRMKCTKVVTDTNDVIFYPNKFFKMAAKPGVGPIISIVYDILYFIKATPKIIQSKARSPGTFTRCQTAFR
jgi:hypothetical protein